MPPTSDAADAGDAGDIPRACGAETGRPPAMPPLAWLEAGLPLPPTEQAWGPGSPAPGLLAAGGELTPQRLAEAYDRGVFPWFSRGEPPLWWSPDPRMVLPVAGFAPSASLRKTLRRFLRTPGAEIRVDHDFAAVMKACASAPRPGQRGTWIVPAMVRAYSAWHALGATHSVETWLHGECIGGLYLVQRGAMLYGESMFARRSDASKIALAYLVALARAHGAEWIDCQQETAHLASLGAQPVARAEFERRVAEAVSRPLAWRWAYDPAHWAQLGL